jgi:putative ABC transport system permease protein
MTRLYGWLLALYPAWFRARFEADMRATFERDHERARQGGRRALIFFWLRTIAEALRFGLTERLAPRPVTVTHDTTSGGAPMSSRLAVDWRDAWRALRATPVVTSMAVLSLALGIGANTALFSILNSLVLKTLPVRNPQELVVLQGGSWTNPIWEQIRVRQSQIGAGAFAWATARFDLARHGETDPVDGVFASGEMFELLGLQAARGRLFTTADDVLGGLNGSGLAVVSHRFWRERLGMAGDVIGRRVTLDRVPFTIVGVMPREFTGPDVGRACDIVVPLGHEPLIRGGTSWLDGRATWWLEVMVRLKPGQTVDQANAALRGIQPQIREATIPEMFTPPMQATYLTDPFTLTPAASGRSGLRTQFQHPLIMMMIVVGAVLLIACANIANLLLARASARRRDLTVRLALGASRARIARQLLCESLLIAAGGALLGLIVARAGASFLMSQFSTSYLDTSLDLRVLAFTAGVGLITALVFGIAPALGASRLSPYEAMKDQARTIAGDRRFGFRNTLIVVQVALSVALVVAAGLFVRTFQALSASPLGFNVDSLLTASVDVRRSDTIGSLTTPSDPARRALYERLRETAAAVPGVKSAALSRIGLLTGGGWNTAVTLPDGQRGQPGIRNPWLNGITPGWFQTYGIRVTAGRDFAASDVIGTPNVAIVNAAFARRFFNGRNPVGERFSRGMPGGKQIETEIVGMVTDSAYRNVRDGLPAIAYLPLGQMPELDAALTLTVQVAGGDWAGVQRQLGDALTRVDAGVAFSMRPLAERVRSTMVQEKLVAILSGFFGGLALLLAAVGLYGVTAYGVSRRRTEIGVRMALGAEPSRVVALVLGRVAWLVGAGVIIGGSISYWAAKYVAPALLFGLHPRDPATLITAALVLVVVGLITAWLPARRASRIDPTQVLREG